MAAMNTNKLAMCSHRDKSTPAHDTPGANVPD